MGLARKPVMDGDHQEPSSWILDTVFRVGQAQVGKIAQNAKGGWAQGALLAILHWPKDWVRTTDSDMGYNPTR
eukprot:3625651-Amphidinium_carterae.1